MKNAGTTLRAYRRLGTQDLTGREIMFVYCFLLNPKTAFNATQSHKLAYGEQKHQKLYAHEVIHRKRVMTAIKEILKSGKYLEAINDGMWHILKNPRHKKWLEAAGLWGKFTGEFAPDKVLQGIADVTPKELKADREEVAKLLKGKQPALQASEAKENVGGKVEVLRTNVQEAEERMQDAEKPKRNILCNG